MNNAETKIFLFTLPQEIIISEGENKLICNLVVMPRFNPLTPLTAGRMDDAANPLPPFADSAAAFDAFLIKGTEALPKFVDHDASYALTEPVLQTVDADRRTIFEKIGSFFQIKEDYGRTIKLAPIKKYLPEAYRNSYGGAGTTRGAVTDNSYFCALKEDSFKQPPDQEDRDTVNWSQVMAFCLHQPELARQLGLLYINIEMPLPAADYYADGGWVYMDFKDDGSNNGYHLLLPENRQRYAAWIPPLTASRKLFSPVVFPVEKGDAPLTFDNVFDEVSRYSDGFAKIVHASQAVTTDHLSENNNGPAPVSDMGIRLAWDDEQVLEWYNRGFESHDKIAGGGISDTPLVISKYRIDVADITLVDGIFEENDPTNQSSGWKSQVSVTADNLNTEGIALGAIDAELGVAVSPAKHGDAGDFWLPAYFTNWNGSSLCLPDPVAEKINELDLFKNKLLEANGGDAAPAIMYRQKEADKLELKYGNRYAFRVRLSDISGGGPGPEAFSLNKGPHKIALQTFKRFVAPQPAVIHLADNKQSIQIERPRLNYPAILFTDVNTNNAIAELLADRQQLIEKRQNEAERFNKKWLREVSLPDPDATQVEIIVEIKSLDMDREDSYNALQKKAPKEAFVFLYKTFRNFPAYELDHQRLDDVIDLALSYVDISVIHFKAPDDELGFGSGLHSDTGPLLLPTARDIRLSIRTWCSNDKPDYFGTDDARRSIASLQMLRQDPVQLEAEPLLIEPAEPLVSIFFQPHPIVNSQFTQQQKMQGKGNEAELDLLDRLASITGLVHKKESILGKDNRRTQFGCSATINHSLSPDRSVVTFSSRDDFYHKWINVLQIDCNRDWTWDLLQPDSFTLIREWKRQSDDEFGEKEDLGGIYLTSGVNWQTLQEPDRSFTRLIFIDALDPKPAAGQFPEPLDVRYTVIPQFKKTVQDGIPVDLAFNEGSTIKQFTTLLPITTPPAQVPKIVSVGIALSPDNAEEILIANRYSETARRNRYLWIEFDQPLMDEKDMYFARVLAYAPDPMLAALDDQLTGATFNAGQLAKPSNPNWERDWNDYLKKEQTEPPINLDREAVRIVRPGQPFDQSGLDAMQAMIPSGMPADEKPRHFLLPLPPGIYPDGEDLFGFFTYEFRVGHQDPKKWSTAQGRFGSPLRLSGVQHPAPPMLVSTIRDRDKVLVSTHHAQSFFNGRNLTPAVPRTDIYACLYAQVLQADGGHYRNVLIDRLLLMKPTFTKDLKKITAYNKRKEASEDVKQPFIPPEAPVLLPGSPPYAVNFFNLSTIRKKLRFLGIHENASLSVLCIELMPRNDYHNGEVPAGDLRQFILSPQPLALDQVRILRTSRLCAVMDSCAIEK